MISLQTNVASLAAQENLRVNTNFQKDTIEKLTSGYRINRAGDDAAGLAAANQLRSKVAELNQGVLNANDGAGQLQIMDGGLSNIGNILDRLKTLATESASDTFSGNRSTLNSEYQSLLQEVNRQASNIGLSSQGGAGSQFNKNLSVYIGGGSTQTNAQVSVDLGGAKNLVDSSGLAIGSTSIDAGGTALSNNSQNTLNNTTTMILTTHTTGGKQTFDINYIDGSGTQQVMHASVTSTDANGISVSAAVNQLNSQLTSINLTAAVDSSGQLVIGGTTGFALVGAAVTANAGGSGSISATSGLTSTTATGYNKSDYNVQTTFAAPNSSQPEIISFSNGQVTKFVTLDSTLTDGADLADAINQQTASMGITAIVNNSGGTGVSIESTGSFTMTMVQHDDDGSGNAAGPFTGSYAVGQQIDVTGPSTTASTTGNALSALTAINNAVAQLGQVQGRVGAGENQLKYAINLAQSQITNFSSADSQIRDADVAAEAANLTKAQVLQQASIAAMAQANSAPQQILSLLRG
ncbi:MAG TPA: flagellin [Candidatus Limnocylindrales bacterium]|nr:flagellin [Candidatus Limnocylindrales bacterium]